MILIFILPKLLLVLKISRVALLKIKLGKFLLMLDY